MSGELKIPRMKNRWKFQYIKEKKLVLFRETRFHFTRRKFRRDIKVEYHRISRPSWDNFALSLHAFSLIDRT